MRHWATNLSVVVSLTGSGVQRPSGPPLVGLRPFSLVLLDMPCYILNHFEHASREVPGVNSESRMTMQQERWLSVEEIATPTNVKCSMAQAVNFTNGKAKVTGDLSPIFAPDEFANRRKSAHCSEIPNRSTPIIATTSLVDDKLAVRPAISIPKPLLSTSTNKGSAPAQ